jgi:hypothetical protein
VNENAFLYIMSSLIQVFGALVAADTVFLVILHEALTRRKNQILQRIGIYVAAIAEAGNLPDFRHPNLDIARYAACSQLFLAMDDVQQQEHLDQANGQLENSCRAQSLPKGESERRRQGLSLFQTARIGLTEIDKQLRGFPRLVMATMSIPAVLSALFSILLWLGSAKGWYNYVAGISIMCACLGFAWIIYWAVRAWPKAKEPSREIAG